jgi:hypothetical protein
MNSYSEHYKALIRRIGISFLSFTLARLLFLAFNYSKFEEVGLYELIVGLRFDALSIAWIFLPFIALSALPVPFRGSGIYQSILKTLFHLSNTVCIIFNLVDVEFFKVINNRSTASLFDMAANESNFGSMVLDYTVDFWYLWFIAGIFVFISERLYQLTAPKKEIPSRLTAYYSMQLAQFSLTIGFLVLGLRGGVQPIPISIVNAGDMVDVKMAPLVLNTPFTILKTLETPGMSEVNYMTEQEANDLITLVHQPDLTNKKWDKPNVVLIILESFSKEYIGYYNNGVGFTPFLDSLFSQSLTFENSFANGMQSVDGIPSITASIPLFMSSSLITSPYSSNQFNSLANTLGEFGYETSFYHGGNDGTMGFDKYTKVAGYSQCNEMTSFPDYEDVFDGTWGIPDEPFLGFFADELAKKEAPFFATVFTLSSHHPYKIPEKYKGKFPTGKHPILEAVAYADYSLKQFFEKVKKTSWYNNTLFVITADHTSYRINKAYDNKVGVLKVPIAFYKPTDSTLAKVNNEVFQQIDIMPTVLDWVGYDKTYFSFGSPLSDSLNRRAVFGKDLFQLIKGDYILLFNGTETKGLYNYKIDPNLKNDLSVTEIGIKTKIEKEIKAFRQLYNKHIIYNQLLPFND